MDSAWTIHADNMIRYGVLGARFGDVYNIAPTTFANFQFGNYHPPLLTLVLIPSRMLFGTSEFATRITPIFFTLFAMAALYRLADRTFPGSALLAVFFAAFAPVVMYYSSITTQELLTLLWIGLTLDAYSRWLDAGESRWRRWLVVLAILGGWTDWVYYLLVAYLLLHAVWAAGLKRTWSLWPLVLASSLAAVAYLAVNLWQRPDFIQAFLQGMLSRVGNTASGNPYFGTGYPGFGPYLIVMIIRLGQVFTPIVILLAGIGGWQVWRHRHQAARSVHAAVRHPSILLLPVATTLTFMLVLQREAHYIHDFLVYHLILFLAPYAAYGYRQILYRFGRPTVAGQGILSVVLGLFLVAAVGYWGVYRSYDYLPDRAAWGQAIRPYVQPGDVLMGNLEQSLEYHRLGFGQTLGYYAGTDARWNVPVEDILEGVVSPDFYVYCPPTVAVPGVSGQLPEALATQAVERFERDGCWFVDLKA